MHIIKIKQHACNFTKSLAISPSLFTPQKKPEFRMKAVEGLKYAASTLRQRSWGHAARAGKALMPLAAMLLILPAPTASASVLATVFTTGPSAIVDSESAVSGRVSAELSGGGNAGAGSYSYLGTAYASSTRGSLGVASQATGSAYDVTNDRLVVHSRASLGDAFIFSHSGQVTFRLDVQGSFVGDSGGQMNSKAELQLFCGGCLATVLTSWKGGNQFFNINNQTNETVISNLPSNYQVWLEHTMSVTKDVPVPFDAKLEVFVAPPTNGNARALFNQTAYLQLLLPGDMTYTSRSGDYFAPGRSPIPTAVSEPPMALTALALLFLMRGRWHSVSSRRR